jgi:hypothetical protein
MSYMNRFQEKFPVELPLLDRLASALGGQVYTRFHGGGGIMYVAEGGKWIRVMREGIVEYVTPNVERNHFRRAGVVMGLTSREDIEVFLKEAKLAKQPVAKPMK